MSSFHNLILSIDGGGTKTNAAVCDIEGNVLGLATAGPSNYHSLGIATTKQNLHEAISTALSNAGITNNCCFQLAFFGLAGLDHPQDSPNYEAIIKDLPWPIKQIHIINDARLSLALVNTGGPGMIVVSGTGSIAYGLNAFGQEARAGGWGYLLGDEGSGYDLGLKTLRTVTKALDGCLEADLLTSSLLKHLQLNSASELTDYFYEIPKAPSEIASIARLTHQLAQEGDIISQKLCLEASQDLALIAYTVLKKLTMTDAAVNIGLSGGAFQSNFLVNSFIHELLKKAPKAIISPLELPAVYGGLIMALNYYHSHPTLNIEPNGNNEQFSIEAIIKNWKKQKTGAV